MSASIQLWLLISLCFTVYFITTYIFKIIGIANLSSAVISKTGITLINLKHTIGIILFGAFVFLMPSSRSLLTDFEFPSSLITFLFVVSLVLTAYFSNRFYKTYIQKDRSLKRYWIKHATNYVLIRIVFLLVYEFFFRGILLFSFLEVTTPILAIALCTALYLLIHCFDSRTELFGALPFGIILCLFTYYTDNIWMAFYLHVTLSMVYEFSLLTYFKIKNQKS